MEDEDYIKASSRWLFEMGWIDNDYVKSALMVNMYNASSHIQDVEFLADQHNSRLLIYLKLGFFGRLLKKESQIESNIKEIIGDALPSYEIRVIYDYEMFEKSIKLLGG